MDSRSRTKFAPVFSLVTAAHVFNLLCASIVLYKVVQALLMFGYAQSYAIASAVAGVTVVIESALLISAMSSQKYATLRINALGSLMKGAWVSLALIQSSMLYLTWDDRSYDAEAYWITFGIAAVMLLCNVPAFVMHLLLLSKPRREKLLGLTLA